MGGAGPRVLPADSLMEGSAQRRLLPGIHGRLSDGQAIGGATFSRDGSRIATGSTDRSARLWDARTGLELLAWSNHPVIVGPLSFSPDRRRLALAGEDRAVRLYILDMEELLALTRDRLTRSPEVPW